MMMKTKILIVIAIVFIATVPFISFGQTLDGPTPDSGGVPVDGGIITLVVAGAAYGAKKLYNKKIKK